MAYTQQVAMCLSDKVTLCTSFNTGPVLTALHSTGSYVSKWWSNFVYIFLYRASTDNLYTQQLVAIMCWSEVTLCMSFNTGPLHIDYDLYYSKMI